ncbi:hypothetical protein E4G67_00555 [Candidatus Bathyarchaeota archaeon]|nr:MAG: hypothetical protein E4G67_00555 [Candidatus Bathyarchaeota archaeon]
MTWGGIGASGQFGTINTGGGIAHVDYEIARGDASGLVDNLIVIGLQGRPLSPLTPISGYVLSWTGTTWVPVDTTTLVAGLLPHNILSLTHTDSIPAAPTVGDIITATSGVPSLWGRFGIGTPGQSLSVNDLNQLEWRDPNIVLPLIVTSGAVVNLANENRRVVIVKTIGSSTLVNLPIGPTLGQEVMIKDGKGDAGNPLFNIINIMPASGTTIDGFNTIRIRTNYQAYTLMWNGLEWNII